MELRKRTQAGHLHSSERRTQEYRLVLMNALTAIDINISSCLLTCGCCGWLWKSDGCCGCNSVASICHGVAGDAGGWLSKGAVVGLLCCCVCHGGVCKCDLLLHKKKGACVSHASHFTIFSSRSLTATHSKHADEMLRKELNCTSTIQCALGLF